MKWLFIGFVKAWRAIVSPWYGPCCRYYPSCSAYALEALQLHGAIKGLALSVRRLFRCNPWSRGGFDPVPGSPLEIRAEQWWPEEHGPIEDDRVSTPETNSALAAMG